MPAGGPERMRRHEEARSGVLPGRDRALDRDQGVVGVEVSRIAQGGEARAEHPLGRVEAVQRPVRAGALKLADRTVGVDEDVRVQVYHAGQAGSAPDVQGTVDPVGDRGAVENLGDGLARDDDRDVLAGLVGHAVDEAPAAQGGRLARGGVHRRQKSRGE